MKKRIGLLLTLAAVVGAMVAISATGAAAEPVCTVTGPEPGALFTETCVETTTTTRTETEQVTDKVCQIGQSGRTGTQEGFWTREYKVTTTETTVTVYQGIPQPWKVPVSGPTTTTDVSEELTSETFTSTSRCIAPTGRP
jgi:hypothetical protein